MTKVVAITGGIGSGKSTVALLFADLNIPVYMADDEAKKLMIRSKVIRRKLIALFGEQAYKGKNLNKPFLSKKIFFDSSLLEQMNAIIHPKVGLHFKRWLKKQNGPYVIKESALVFETGNYKSYDFIIVVTAPIQERIKRTVLRDKTTDDKVKSIIRNQWEDSKKIKHADFHIDNIDIKSLKPQVINIHEEVLNKL